MTRPSTMRVVAAILTSATAGLLLFQLVREGHADENAAPEPPAQVARAETPTVRAIPTPDDTVLPPPPRKLVPAKKPRLRARHFMPVKDFGGY